jgi:hypothetical protein
MRALAFVMVVLCFTACTKVVEVKIVSVEDEERWGATDGTTVVECPNRIRLNQFGKLGKPGDTFLIRLELGHPCDWGER